MKSVTIMATLTLVIVFATAPAMAQRMSGLRMRGTISSASASVPGGGSAVVYTAPGNMYFVLTQVCFGGGGMKLTSSNFGSIVNDLGPCTTYTPGVAISPGESMTCSNPNSVDCDCMVTGILMR